MKRVLRKSKDGVYEIKTTRQWCGGAHRERCREVFAQNHGGKKRKNEKLEEEFGNDHQEV